MRRKLTHVSVSMNSLARPLLYCTCIVVELRPPRLSFITLSLPDANGLYQLAIRWLNITLLSYTSTRCRCIWTANISHAQRACNISDLKRNHFSKGFTILNCGTCAVSAHMTWITDNEHLEFSVPYINSVLNFKIPGKVYPRTVHEGA